MAFTRKQLASIEGLTPEQIDAIMAMHGASLSGYLTKEAADELAKAEAEKARKAAEDAAAEALKAYDVKGSDAYKALEAELVKERAMASEDFAGIKPKFRATVYGMIDHADGAKPLAEQFEGIRKDYEEYFLPAQDPGKDEGGNEGGEGKKNTPQYSDQGKAGGGGDNKTAEEKAYETMLKGWKG